MTQLTPLALLLVTTPAVFASPAPSAANGNLSGIVRDDQGRPVPKALVILRNPVSGYRQAVSTDSQGRYVLHNIPLNDYHLEVNASGFGEGHQNLKVRSNLPLELDVVLKPASATVVVEDQLNLLESQSSTRLDIDKSTIEKIPTAVQSRALESILLSTPGFIQDENGRFHFRGSHGQVMYVVDGVPVTDQVQATFSNSFDPAQVESLEVVTGGISAEHGGKPVAVVNVTSKSGLGTPNGFEGEASFGVARFRTVEIGFGARGGSSRFGYFVTGAASSSDRFLDPVNFDNLHNQGSTGRLFGRFDWILTDRDTLRLSVSGGRTRRDVVNLTSQEAAGQDLTVENIDANLSLGWTHLFDANRSLDAAFYTRQSTAKLIPTQDLQPGFAPGGPDFPVWARQDRNLANLGATLAFTQRFGENTIKVGLQHVSFPIHERFAFGITDGQDVELNDPSNPFYRYTPSGGSNLFRFEDRITPRLSSAFIQTDWHLGQWVFAGGMRYDRYSVKSFTESEVQPRLGASYRIEGTGTVLRVSYDRLMITPENENLALSLSQQAWDLGPNAGTPVPPLRSEIQSSVTWGIEQQFGQMARVAADYWEKRSRNAADNEQFLNTGVLFPIAADRAVLRGWDLRLDLVPVHGFSAYLSLGQSRAIFQAPVVGGLQLESPEAAPGERFLIDHDEKLAAQIGLRYESKTFYAQIIGRYDSGLVAGDPGDAAGNPDLDFGTKFVHLDSEGNWRVNARTTWNLSLGKSWKLSERRSILTSVDLLNATDVKGLYNFLSVFGGTHVIPPRTLAIRLKYRF